MLAIFNNAVDQSEIEGHLYGEDATPERRFGNIEREDYFPGEVEGERENGHAIGTRAEGGADEENVGYCPKDPAGLEKAVRHGLEVGGDVVGAHYRQ
jgi:hypothetical protein